MQLHAQRPVRAPARLRACAPARACTRCAAASASLPAPYAHETRVWTWRGHRVVYTAQGPEDGLPCVLIHGFGASSRQFRAVTAGLVASGRRVLAPDLLGFGESAKPALEYTIELWRDQVTDFMAEALPASGRGAVLMGNSIGGLVALAAAAAAAPNSVAGVVLFNSAGGMNNSARSDDWRAVLAAPLFALVNALLLSPAAAPIFEAVRGRENVTGLLRGVYAADPSRVDEELVSLVYDAAADEGALGACVRIITGPPGPRPEALVPEFAAPLCAIWGDADKLTPADGPVGQFFAALPATRAGTRFHLLPGLGHCLFDEAPATVMPLVLAFLDDLP
jgi:pimeloyl-ACP methyl ester carboxylesterase